MNIKGIKVKSYFSRIIFTTSFFICSSYSFSNTVNELVFEHDTLKSTDGQTVPDSITASSVIQNYIDAIGGTDSIANVTDRTTIMRGSVQGQNVTIVSYQKFPNKLKQEIKIGSLNQQLLFDGQKGFMITGENEIEITGEEFEKLSMESTLDFILHPEDFGVKITLAGMKIVEGKNCYELDFVLPSGTYWTQFFDVETGYKVKEEKQVVTAKGSFDQETFFYDYKSINGIKYPFRIRQSFGAQQLEFNVSSVKINSGLRDEIFVIK